MRAVTKDIFPMNLFLFCAAKRPPRVPSVALPQTVLAPAGTKAADKASSQPKPAWNWKTNKPVKQEANANDNQPAGHGQDMQGWTMLPSVVVGTRHRASSAATAAEVLSALANKKVLINECVVFFCLTRK